MGEFSELKEATNNFFRLHWCTEELSCNKPEWMEWEEFLCGSVPNYDKGGCYALFENTKLIYVGFGGKQGERTLFQSRYFNSFNEACLCLRSAERKKPFKT